MMQVNKRTWEEKSHSGLGALKRTRTGVTDVCEDTWESSVRVRFSAPKRLFISIIASKAQFIARCSCCQAKKEGI